MTDFLAAMPEAYRRAFGTEAVAEHAGIVARRGSQVVHAELCGTGGVCVVADDQPGLLALITDALLVQGLSIRSAQAYCRQRSDGTTEAVDFLEIHPARARGQSAAFDFDASELQAFLQTLHELIAADVRASSHANAAPAPRGTPTRVYFELEALRQGQYVLLVEAPDSQGLLHAIASALHAQGARIVACQIGTDAELARDRFDIASADAEPLTGADLCDIQLAVLDSIRQRP